MVAVGGGVLVGETGVVVGGGPTDAVLIATLSTYCVRGWLDESLPICTVSTPTVPRLPVVVW